MKIKGIVALVILFSCSHVFAQAGYEKNKIKFLTAIYGYGERDAFDRPTDIFVDSRGDIYLADSYKKAIFIFDSDFMPVAKIDKVNGLLARPLSVAANDEGVLFVSEESIGNKPGRLLSFNFRGEFKKQIKFKGFKGADRFSALDMAVDKEGNLYLAGGKAGLVILDKAGRYLKTIRSGSINSEYIRCVEVKGGNIFVFNSGTCRIYVYDREGNFIIKFGRAGGVAGTLSRPQGLAVDNQTGLIYVADYMRHCLTVYDQKGKYLFEYGGLGTGAGWFNYPKGIFIDHGGRLLVVDTFNKRVQVFTMRD